MQLKIEKGTFTNHSLEDIASALKKGLSENFKNVEVEVVDCPNLREWDCPSEGISGNQKIIDVGGEPYMHDPNFIGAEFDYQEISKMIGSEKSYALGAGSGAMSCLDGHCGELVINENLITDESRSIIARVSPDKKCIVEKYSARKHGGLGNIYYTDGKQGKVIKIKIKGRSGDQGSLPQAMRSSLSNNLNFKANEQIALAGVFRNNIKHDDWSERERSLRDVSDYEGTLKKRGNFEGEIVMSRYMNRSNSMLVAVLSPNNNIIKFFYDLYRDNTAKEFLAQGSYLRFSAYVKSHEVSDCSKCKETFCNRVTLSKEDK